MRKFGLRKNSSGEIATILTALTFIMIVGGVLIGSRLASNQRLQTSSNAEEIVPTLSPGTAFRVTELPCKVDFAFTWDPTLLSMTLRSLDGSKVYDITNDKVISTDPSGAFGPIGKTIAHASGGSAGIAVSFNPAVYSDIFVTLNTGGGGVGSVTRYHIRRPSPDWLTGSERYIVEITYKYKVGGVFKQSKQQGISKECAPTTPGIVTPTVTGSETPAVTITPPNTPVLTITPPATITPCPTDMTTPGPTGNPLTPTRSVPCVTATPSITPPATITPCPTDMTTPGPTGNSLTPTRSVPCVTATPSPTPQIGACPIRIKEYVRICDDASCETWKPTSEFDNAINPSDQFEAFYGSSNDSQLNSKNKVNGQPFGNKPWPFLLWGHPYTDPFGEGAVAGPGVIWFKVVDWKPAATDYYKPGSTALVRGFFNGDKYDLHHIDCMKNGGTDKPCPGGKAITSITAGTGFVGRDGRSYTISASKNPNNPDPAVKDWLVADIPDLALNCNSDYQYGFYLVKKSDVPQACYFRPRNFVQFRLNGQDREVNAFSDIGSVPGLWATINGLRAKLGTSDVFKNFFWSASDPDKKYLRYDPCGGINGGKGCQTEIGKGDFAPGTSGYIVNKDTACVILFRDPKFKVVEKCVPDVKSMGGSLDLDQIRFDKYNCDPVSKTVNSTPDPNNLDPDHQDVICGLPVACSEKGIKYDYGWILEPDKGTVIPTPTPCQGNDCNTPTPPQTTVTTYPTCVPTETPTITETPRKTVQLDLEAAELPDNHGLANPCFVVADNVSGLLNRQDSAYPRPCRVQQVTFGSSILSNVTVAYHNVTNKTIKIGYQLNRCTDAQVTLNKTTGKPICNEYVDGNYGERVSVPADSVYICSWTNPINEAGNASENINCSVKLASEVAAAQGQVSSTQSRSSRPLGGGEPETPTPSRAPTKEPNPTPTDICVQPTSEPSQPGGGLQEKTFQLDVKGFDSTLSGSAEGPCFVVADNVNGLLYKSGGEPKPCRLQRAIMRDGKLLTMNVSYQNPTNKTIKAGFQLNSCVPSQVTFDKATGKPVCNEPVPGASNYNSPITLEKGQSYDCVWYEPEDNPHVQCSIINIDGSLGSKGPMIPVIMPNIQLLQKADVVVDRTINVLDVATCLKEWMLGKSANQKCDMNLNNVVDSIDVAQVLKLIGRKY